MRTRVLPCALVTALALVLSGCSSPGPVQDRSPDDVRLAGWVYTAGPVAGAEVSAGEAKAVTDETGQFQMARPGGGADLVVTAGGGDLPGTLRADLAGTQTVVSIGPLTTLAAVYRESRPQVSRDEADAAVRRYLALPDSYDLGMDARSTSKFFDPRAFMEAAAAAGGFDAFVKELAAQIDTPDATRSFAGDEVELVQGAGGVIAGALLKAAAGKALDEGWKQLFGDGTSRQLEEIKAAIRELQAQIVHLQRSVDEIAKKVDLQAYRSKITRTRTEHVRALRGHLDWIATCTPRPKENPEDRGNCDRTQEIEQILREMQRQSLIQVWQEELSGANGIGTIWDAWGEAVAPKRGPFFTSAHSRELIVGYEQIAANYEWTLVAGAMLLRITKPGGWEEEIQGYLRDYEEVAARIKAVKQLEPDTVIDLRPGAAENANMRAQWTTKTSSADWYPYYALHVWLLEQRKRQGPGWTVPTEAQMNFLRTNAEKLPITQWLPRATIAIPDKGTDFWLSNHETCARQFPGFCSRTDIQEANSGQRTGLAKVRSLWMPQDKFEWIGPPQIEGEGGYQAAVLFRRDVDASEYYYR